MSPSELEIRIDGISQRLGGIEMFLPELVARVKRLEEVRHTLERKIEEQASLIASLQREPDQEQS